MDASQEQRLRALPGYVVLGRRKGANAYVGVVERSWTMELDPERACFFWTGTAHTIVGAFQIDGRRDAEDHRDGFARRYPDMEFEVFDARAPDLPVKIDWDAWIRAQDGSLVYRKRNPPIRMRGDDAVPADRELAAA